MNLKAMEWLQQELPFWVKKGWITESSYRQIESYYGKIMMKRRPSYTRVLILLLGLLLVALGLFLLIMGYWNSFSPNGKADWIFALALVAITVVALALWRSAPGSNFREGAGIFYFLAILGGLFLMADTYPLGNSAGTYLLLTIGLGAAAAYILQSAYTMALVVVAIGLWSWTDGAYLVGSYVAWVVLAMMVPFVKKVFSDSRFSMMKKMVLSWALILGVYASLFFALRHMSAQLNLMLFVNISIVTYLLGKLNRRVKLWSLPLRTVGLLGVFYAIFMGTFRSTWEDTMVFSGATVFPIILAVLTTLFVGFLLVICYEKKYYKELMEGSLSFIVILCSILSIYDVSSLGITVLFDIYIFVIAALAAIIGAMRKNMGAINGAGAAVITIILARFFDPGFTFVERGVSMVILGLLLIIANTLYLWQKANRSREVKRRVRKERREVLYGPETEAESSDERVATVERGNETDESNSLETTVAQEEASVELPEETVSEIERLKQALVAPNTLQETATERQTPKTGKHYGSFTEMANDGLAHTWEVARPDRASEKARKSPWKDGQKADEGKEDPNE